MEFINKQVISKQRNISPYLLKTLMGNLKNGKSILNMSLPVQIFDKRSVLELYLFYQVGPTFTT